MSRMPGAVWQGKEHGTRPMGRVDIVCVHTIVGYAPAPAAHFSTRANGQILQSRDTAYRSAANLDGNPRILAVENEDHGPAFGDWTGSDVPPLTDEQVTANAQILAWAHLEHGVPLQLCPDSLPDSRGLAYHRQGIDGNFGGYRFPGRVVGGEVWTEHRGKVCPGDRRIAQLPEILRRARALVNPTDDWSDIMGNRTDDEIVRLIAEGVKRGIENVEYPVPANEHPDFLELGTVKHPRMMARVWSHLNRIGNGG